MLNLKHILLNSLFLSASLVAVNASAEAPNANYVPVSAEDIAKLTGGSSLSTLLPPGYREPLLDRIPDANSVGGVKTIWGSKPEFDTVVSGIQYSDKMPDSKGLTTLDLKKAPLSSVFSSLARDMHISYISSPDIPDAEITALFSGMSPTDIFRALAQQQNLEVIDYFGAFSLRQKQEPPLILRKYKLDFNYIDAGDTMEAVGAQLQNNSSMSSSGSSGANLGSGMSNVSKSLKADYSEFIDNIKALAKLDLTNATSGQDKRFGGARSAKAGVNPPNSASDESVVIYDQDNRTLLVQATAAGHEAVLTYLETINSPQENVAIEIFVAETSLNPTTDLGVNWSFASENGFTVAYNPAGTASDGTIGLGNFQVDNFSATIKALQADKQGRSYSHPRVLTTNNRSVTLESVVEVPYTSSSSAVVESSGGRTDTNSTDFKRVGITISVVPIIQGNDILRLKVSVTNSTLQGYDEDGEPITSVRSYGGAFSLNSGEYIVIGGLGENRYTNTQTGLAFMQSIPYLGALFGNNNISNETKNLLIFIRPVIKKQFRKGLDVNTMDKGALFAINNKWPLLFNPNDVVLSEDLSEAKDPFLVSDANNAMHTFTSQDVSRLESTDGLKFQQEDVSAQPATEESAESKNGEDEMDKPTSDKKSTPKVYTEPADNDLRVPSMPEEVSPYMDVATLLQKNADVRRKVEEIRRGGPNPTVTVSAETAIMSTEPPAPIPGEAAPVASPSVNVKVAPGVFPVVNGAGQAHNSVVKPAYEPTPIYLNHSKSEQK